MKYRLQPPSVKHTAIKGFSAVLMTIAGLSVSSDIQVGRYAVMKEKPTEGQLHPLVASTEVLFPDDVQSVGQAMRHLLEMQGYALGQPSDRLDNADLMKLLNMPLPEIHRDLGPMTLSDLLETLAGPAWFLVHDPVQRLVSFEKCEPEEIKA